MSGSWESEMVDEALRYGSQDTRPRTLWALFKKNRQAGNIRGLRPLTSMGDSQEQAFVHAIDMAKKVQLGWADLSVEHAVWELRRGEASIFWPLFHHDPVISVECPSGRVHNPGASVTTDYRGECSVCGFDLVTGTLTTEGQDQ